jgi:hypothetical protein
MDLIPTRKGGSVEERLKAELRRMKLRGSERYGDVAHWK